MSDGTRKKKLKLTMSSKNVSPQGSRAGSPDLINGAKPAQGTSRAGSPGISLPPLPLSAVSHARPWWPHGVTTISLSIPLREPKD